MPNKISGYAKAQTGYVSNLSGYKIPTTNIAVGANYTQNGYYVNAELGEGTSFSEKAEIGKKVPLSKNLSLSASVGEQYVVSNSENDYYKNTYYAFDNKTKPDLGPKWKANDLRGYTELTLNYKKSAIEAGIGARFGVQSFTQPSLNGVTLPPVGETQGTEYAGGATKGFAEITGSLGVEFGNWKAKLKASPSQSSLDLSINF